MFHLSEPLIWICCHNRQCQSLNSQNSRNALSCTYALVYKKCWVIRYGFHLIWRESNCVCFKCNTLETRVHVVLTMCLVDNRNKIHNRVVKCGSVICVSFTKDRDFVYLQKKKTPHNLWKKVKYTSPASPIYNSEISWLNNSQIQLIQHPPFLI